MDRRRLGLGIAAIAAIAAARRLAIVPAAAQVKALTDAQDVNGAPGVIAEIVQCKRDNGALSIRMRLRNTGDNSAHLDLVSEGKYDQYYVVAGSKKYFVLRDSEKVPLATPSNKFANGVDTTIPKGGSYVWYAKYPAPPPEVKKVSYYTPLGPPFEDIPVSD